MNYSRAFTYVFEDKNWLSKILIAGLISLIPIIGQFYILGWMIEIVRRVKANRTDILPTTHFSYFLTLGLKAFVVALIYSIPLIIITGIISLINTRTRSYDGNTFTIVVSSMGFFGSIISLVVHIATSLLNTYGIIKLAETDQIKSCLDFKDAYETIKNNLTLFIIVELLSLAAGIIGSAGTILCIIGVIFTLPYGTAITGHLAGQLWKNLGTANRYRGSAKTQSDDVIEEAPFTRVQDIEKNVIPEEPKTEPVPVIISEVSKNVEDTVDSVEPEVAAQPEPEEPISVSKAVETTEDIIEQIETNSSVEPTIKPEAPVVEEPQQDNDIPSFE